MNSPINIPGAVFVGGLSGALAWRFGGKGLLFLGAVGAGAVAGAAWKRNDRNATVREILQDSQAGLLEGFKRISEEIGPTNTMIFGTAAAGLFTWGVVKGFNSPTHGLKKTRKVARKTFGGKRRKTKVRKTSRAGGSSGGSNKAKARKALTSKSMGFSSTQAKQLVNKAAQNGRTSVDGLVNEALRLRGSAL